jgi:hypothetical protein
MIADFISVDEFFEPPDMEDAVTLAFSFRKQKIAKLSSTGFATRLEAPVGENCKQIRLVFHESAGKSNLRLNFSTR